MQLAAYAIFKPDEGFENNSAFCFTNGGKDRRIIVITVFQQSDPVTLLP
jgi:hypothetical protein